MTRRLSPAFVLLGAALTAACFTVPAFAADTLAASTPAPR